MATSVTISEEIFLTDLEIRMNVINVQGKYLSDMSTRLVLTSVSDNVDDAKIKLKKSIKKLIEELQKLDGD